MEQVKKKEADTSSETEIDDDDAHDEPEYEPAAEDLALIEGAMDHNQFLSREEEMALFAEYQEKNSLHILNRLMKSQDRLCHSIANKYARRNEGNPGIDKDDLVQSGRMGLMKAIEKFDPSKGFRLHTYAHWWVKQSIQRYIKINRTPY